MIWTYTASVIGLRFNEGVLIGCDTNITYADRLEKYARNARICAIGGNTLIAGSGCHADLQATLGEIEDLEAADEIANPNYKKSAAEYFAFIKRLQFKKRMDFDPRLNTVVVAGYSTEKQEGILGAADVHGTGVGEEDFVASGVGAYLALPLLRKEARKSLSETEARALLVKCLAATIAWESGTSTTVQIGKVSKDGLYLDAPTVVRLNENLGYATFHANRAQEICAFDW